MCTMTSKIIGRSAEINRDLMTNSKKKKKTYKRLKQEEVRLKGYRDCPKVQVQGEVGRDLLKSSGTMLLLKQGHLAPLAQDTIQTARPSVWD